MCVVYVCVCPKLNFYWSPSWSEVLVDRFRFVQLPYKVFSSDGLEESLNSPRGDPRQNKCYVTKHINRL